MEFLGVAALIIGIGFIALIFMLFMHTILLYFAAAWVSIAQRSFGKAFLSTLLSFILSIFVGFILGCVPFLGWFMSMAASLVLPVLVTWHVYNTSFTKAFLAELIRFCIEAFLLILIGLAFVFFIELEAVKQFVTNLSWGI
jgi:hypothetical protein